MPTVLASPLTKCPVIHQKRSALDHPLMAIGVNGPSGHNAQTRALMGRGQEQGKQFLIYAN